jgi:hypothetical protein
VGVCGYSGGHRDDVFARDIPLKETRLAPGDNYTLDARTIKIPFAKIPPVMNCLCSILSGSAGDAVAEALGSISIPPAKGTRPTHEATVASRQTPRGDYEYWKTTSPADWSDDELLGFLTNSPWAHTVLLRIPSDVIGPNGRPWSVFEQKQVVRWESATLVRDALSRTESKEYNDALADLSKDHYVIALLNVREHRRDVGEYERSRQWSPEQMEGRLKEIQSSQLSPLGLLKRGDESTASARIESGEISEGRVYLYLFPRALALENGNEDLDFEAVIPAGMGRARVGVKFSLKNLAEGLEQGL